MRENVTFFSAARGLLSATQRAYRTLCRAIDAAYQVDEVKDIRDKARALEQYNRQAQNVEAERQACEIRLRAERKAGKLLAEMAKAKGGEHGGKKPLDGNRKSPFNPTPTLLDFGISKKQSSDWQKLAQIPQRDFERHAGVAENVLRK